MSGYTVRIVINAMWCITVILSVAMFVHGH